MWESLIELDQQVFKYINGSYFNRFESFWLFVTRLETWLPLYITFFILLFKLLPGRVNYLACLVIIVSTITSLQLTNLVKNQVQRLRPNNEPLIIDSIQILQKPESFSFWSGHTAVSVTVSLFVYLVLQHYKPSRWWLLFFIWPFLFAVSRIFVGVHYPGDVLVGALVGILLGTSFHKLFRNLAAKLEHTTQC